MNYFFITGSSKGLGKSLSELLLQNDNNCVYGIARSNTINHPNYHHISIDLSNIIDVKTFTFPELANAEKVVLINNAGMVGDVQHTGNINNDKIIECYNLNLIAPAILTNIFMSSYDDALSKMIINISSGAGRHPIDGWNVYCSTKAGMDMFSKVVNEEINISGSNTTILSLAPGIIDTGMQTEIRNSDQSGFSNIERFIEYKANGDLVHPDQTAQQVERFIEEPHLAENVICSVRDLVD